MSELKDMKGKGDKLIIKKGKSNKIAIWAAFHLSALQQITGIQIVIIYAG